MDFETLKMALGGAVPLNRTLGLQIVEIAAGRGVVRLPDDERLRNHVGSQHAAALFAAAETASGAAMLGALADHMSNATPLARGARIKYSRIARGVITATAVLETPIDGLVRSLADDGRAQFEIDVDLTDVGGEIVARMTVEWVVTAKPAAAAH